MDLSRLSTAFGAVMDSQLFWGLVTLVLAAVAFSPRISVNASTLLLCVAWVVGCFGIYRTGLLSDWRHMVAAWLFFGGTLAMFAAWLQPTARIDTAEQPTENFPLHFHASTRAADRQAGTIIGGIPWRPNYGELKVWIQNGADVDYQSVDLQIVPDVAATAVAQLTNIQGVSISINHNPEITMEMVNHSSGKRIDRP